MRRTSVSVIRRAAWLLLLALSACAARHAPVDRKPGPPQPAAYRSAEPAARQRQAPVEKPQRQPDYPAPQKREHDIEED